MRLIFVSALLAATALTLSACITTSMQGYADKSLPKQSIRHIAVLVSAAGPLATSMEESAATEGKKHGVAVEDAFTLFPPTRTYSNAEVRQGLLTQGLDGVLLINVGDSGVVKEYAGTVFSGTYSGATSLNGNATQFGNLANLSLTGSSNGSMTASSTPTYRYSRQTASTARLIEPATGRNLWVGRGQVSAGGALFVGNGMSAGSAMSAIFDDLQQKTIIAGT